MNLDEVRLNMKIAQEANDLSTISLNEQTESKVDDPHRIRKKRKIKAPTQKNSDSKKHNVLVDTPVLYKLSVYRTATFLDKGNLTNSQILSRAMDALLHSEYPEEFNHFKDKEV